MPSRLYAVDPGLRCCGAAYFEDSILQWAKLIDGNIGDCPWQPMAWALMADEVEDGTAIRGVPECRFVVEFPRAYVGAKSGGDYEDLLQLAAVIGAMRPHQIVRPHEWKGQLDKKRCHERILERLSEEEESRIVRAGAKTHNVLDAVGIGLFCLGRFNRRRVFSS